MGGYWKHLERKHGEAGKAIKARYDEFKGNRVCRTALPAATRHDANFRARLLVRPEPTQQESRSAPVDPAVHQQEIASFAGSLKAAPKTLKRPKWAPRPLTIPAHLKLGGVKTRDPVNANSDPPAH